jgi:hypothetical protein
MAKDDIDEKTAPIGKSEAKSPAAKNSSSTKAAFKKKPSDKAKTEAKAAKVTLVASRADDDDDIGFGVDDFTDRSVYVSPEELSGLTNNNSAGNSAEGRRTKIIELLPDFDVLSASLVEAVDFSTENTKRLESQEKKLSTSLSTLADFKKQQVKLATIMLVTTGGIVAVTLGLFLVAILSLSGKGDELSALNLALGKRIVNMNTGLESFEGAKAEVSNLRSIVEELSVALEQTQASYQDSEQGIAGKLSTYSASLVSGLNDQNDTLGRSFEVLESKVSTFEASLQQFSERLSDTDKTLADIEGNSQELLDVREVIDALLILEREKYIEAIEKRNSGNPTPEDMAKDAGEIYFASPARNEVFRSNLDANQRSVNGR